MNVIYDQYKLMFRYLSSNFGQCRKNIINLNFIESTE